MSLWLPPTKIRVSLGTAVVLGLEIAFMKDDATPTTAYLQTYHPHRCIANCKFCAQARDSRAQSDRITRGLYPPFEFDLVLQRLRKATRRNLIKRTCIQTMNYPNMFNDLVWLVERIKEETTAPISVSIHPVSHERLKRLKEAGAERLVIPLDAANEELFDEIKGAKTRSYYRWGNHMKSLKDAVRVMGTGNAGTHLIVGLGETETDAVSLIQRLNDMGVYCGLFAFTSIPGTPLEDHPSPPIKAYRRVQIARHLISNNISHFKTMIFNEEGELIDFGIKKEELNRLIMKGKPLLTSGCPHCNRPYATETPGMSIYNYPRIPSKTELQEIKRQIESS
jgi:biotin synthase